MLLECAPVVRLDLPEGQAVRKLRNMEGGTEERVEPSASVNWPRGLVGAGAGGGAGYFLFGWLASQGFYAVALPGVLLGIGAGWVGRGRSKPFAVVCGVLGLVLGIIAEWAHFPFARDRSLFFFLMHLLDLQPVSLIFIALGSVAAYWFSGRWGDGRRSAG